MKILPVWCAKISWRGAVDGYFRYTNPTITLFLERNKLKLPSLEKAVVSEPKMTEYLLSPTHPEGRDKAAFFTRFGFTIDEWVVLAEALMEHAKAFEVTKTAESRFGIRYVIEGQLQTPDGRNPIIRSVWFIAHEDDTPRFVTAYPD